MNESLRTYLHDHLAGAEYAINLLEFMRDQHSDDQLGRFATDILLDIKQDRDTLRDIAARLGAGGSTLKEAASWVGEKVSRFKLGHDAGSGLATFEALEFLALGILGKRALWCALAAIAPSDRRLAGIDFGALAARAQKQHDRVDQHRLMAARAALGRGGESSRATYNHDSSSHTKGAFSMRKATVVGSIAATVGVLLAVAMLPDIARYMKLRAM